MDFVKRSQEEEEEKGHNRFNEKKLKKISKLDDFKMTLKFTKKTFD